MPGWIRRLDAGQELHLVDVVMGDGETLKAIQDLERRWSKEALVVCGWTGTEISFRLEPDRMAGHERLTLLVTSGRPLEFLQTHIGDRLVRPDAEPTRVEVEEAPPGAEEESDGEMASAGKLEVSS